MTTFKISALFNERFYIASGFSRRTLYTGQKKYFYALKFTDLETIGGLGGEGMYRNSL